MLDAVPDAEARHLVLKWVAVVVCSVVHAERVTRAIGDTGTARGGDSDSFVDALVHSGEALGVHGRQVLGDILDCADNSVVAVGADGDNPLEVDNGVVCQEIDKAVADRSLGKQKSVATFQHKLCCNWQAKNSQLGRA